MAVAHLPWQQAQATRQNLHIGKILAWIVCVGVLVGINVVLVPMHPRPQPKVDANGMLSPWDRSMAPPQYAKPSSSAIRPLPSLGNPGRSRHTAKAKSSPVERQPSVVAQRTW